MSLCDAAHRFFQRGLLAAALGATGMAACDVRTPCTPDTSLRPDDSLKRDEIFIGKGVYGDYLNTGGVTLTQCREPKKDIIAEVWEGRRILYWGPEYNRANHARLEDAARGRKNMLGIILHELIHIVQAQNPGIFSGHCPKQYRYALTKDTDITTFCDERQGGLMEDYARRFLLDDPVPSLYLSSVVKDPRKGKEGNVIYVPINDTPETDTMLADAVERTFRGAAEFRRRLKQEQRERMKAEMCLIAEFTGPPLPTPQRTPAFLADILASFNPSPAATWEQDAAQCGPRPAP